jgi:Holliday junction resolvasome RuvABC DNA-binding subunit
MTEIDPKKIENKDLRHQIAKDIVAIRNLESISDKTKEKLIRDLIDKKTLTETTNSQESNEKEKVPELEENNFHIDST